MTTPAMTTTGRSTVQWVALIFGIGFLIVTILGFLVTGMTNMEADPATAPRVLGIFPVNVLHNLVHLVFGVWGLAASRSFDASKTYCTVSGVIYVLLFVLGFIAPAGFGLVPLGGPDVWLHLVLGVPLLAAGLTATRTVAA